MKDHITSLNEYMNQSCCTIEQCPYWDVKHCRECRMRMVKDHENMIIDKVKDILQEHEGTFFWYEEVCRALDEMMEKKHEHE